MKYEIIISFDLLIKVFYFEVDLNKYKKLLDVIKPKQFYERKTKNILVQEPFLLVLKMDLYTQAIFD